jgi:hypothetical protein
MGSHHSDLQHLAVLDIPPEARRVAMLVLADNHKARPTLEMIAQAHGTLPSKKRTGSSGRNEDVSHYFGHFPDVRSGLKFSLRFRVLMYPL